MKHRRQKGNPICRPLDEVWLCVAKVQRLTPIPAKISLRTLEIENVPPTFRILVLCLGACMERPPIRGIDGPFLEATMPLIFKPKLDKVIELLLYLAHKRPGADKYQASKFFYFADREHLARFGRPISYEPYFALWYGPSQPRSRFA